MPYSSLTLHSREWQVDPNTLHWVPGSQAEGQSPPAEAPCLPVCMNEGEAAGLGKGWAPTPPPARTWLPAAFPGLAKEGGKSRWGTAERCNLSREEFPALPPSFIKVGRGRAGFHRKNLPGSREKWGSRWGLGGSTGPTANRTRHSPRSPGRGGSGRLQADPRVPRPEPNRESTEALSHHHPFILLSRRGRKRGLRSRERVGHPFALGQRSWCPHYPCSEGRHWVTLWSRGHSLDPALRQEAASDHPMGPTQRGGPVGTSGGFRVKRCAESVLCATGLGAETLVGRKHWGDWVSVLYPTWLWHSFRPRAQESRQNAPATRVYRL